MSCARRFLFLSLLIALFFAGGASLMAYPVSITINATFSTIPGDADPLGLGSAEPPTAVITTTVDSSTPQASYPVTVYLTVPAAGFSNTQESGTLTIGTNGQLTANFSNAQGSFSAVLVLSGVTFPNPVPTAFGNASFNAPASTVSYNLLGAQGTVGITGTVSAVGLTASPTTAITATYQVGGTAPAPQQITISSNDPANPAIPYSVVVTPTNGTPAGFVTLSSAGGTTPENEMISFGTTLGVGTYTGNIEINSGTGGAPISIPVTYTVSQGAPSGGISASPSSLTFNYTTGGTVPAAQTVALAATGSTQLSFTATSNVPWATVTTSAATTPATLTVTVNPASLPAGTASGAITVTSSAATLMIPISVVVSTGGSGGSGTLQVTPSMLSFQFYSPASTTASQTVSVTSTGAAQAFTASVASGSFLTVSTSGGTTPASLTVTANTAGLAQGTYTGSVQVISDSGTVTLPVTVVYGGSVQGTTISAAPASLTFEYTAGGTVPPPQLVTVTGATPIHFTANNISFYLPVTPNSATTNATLSVSLNPAGLSRGTLNYNLVIVPDTGTTLTIPVTVKVNPATVTGPVLSATPQTLTFASPATSDAPASQTLSIAASVSTAFTASTSVPWLSLSATSGTTAESLTVTASPNGLAVGTYTGNVVISATGAATLTIPVTYTVTQAVGPNLTFSPTALAFAYQTGGTAPAAQTVTLTPATSGLTYTVTGIGAAWLTSTTSSDNSQVTVSVNTDGLAPGTYYGSLKVEGSGLTVTPLFVPITLTVSTGPTLGVSPTSLTFTSQPGGAAPPAQVIAVAGSDAIPFTVASDSAWIAATASGTSSPGSVTVTVTPGSMAAGMYSGSVTLTAGGSTPQTITVPVSLYINATAVPVVSAITDAISYLHQTASPGGIVALWGMGLGPSTPAPLVVVNSNTIATAVGGTQVFADGIPCPILFSSSGQVNVVLPFSLQGKTSTQIHLVYQGVSSNTITLPVEASVPGLFSLDSTGKNGGAILNQDLSVNSASNPAPAGTVVALFGGGAGQTNPAGADGLIVPITAPYPAPVLTGSVTLAGQAATVSYFGDAPALVSGVIQVNVTIPAGTPSGPQPVVLTVGGAASQPNLLVYVK